MFDFWAGGYIFVVSLMAFCLMGIDKKRAQRGAYRIAEKTLWFWAVIGGGTGAFLGMRHFRHKTKHASFKWGLPVLMVLQIGWFVANIF